MKRFRKITTGLARRFPRHHDQSGGRARVEAAFARHEHDRRGPVQAALGEGISYDGLHIVRLPRVLKSALGFGFQG